MIYTIPADQMVRYPRVRARATSFLHERVRHLIGEPWTLGEFAEWFFWHCRYNFAVAIGERDRIMGVAAFRPVFDFDKARLFPYHFSERTDSPVWLDQVAADRSDIPHALWIAGIRQIGRERNRVAYLHGRRNHRVVTWPVERFVRRLGAMRTATHVECQSACAA